MSNPRAYRTEVPNLWDDSDLDPYQFRLLVHIKRRGVCFETVRSLADHCNMSVGKVSQVRTWLLENGWIEHAKDERTGKMGVRAVDMWAENQATYAPDPAGERSPHEQTQQKERSRHEQQRSSDEHRSPHEHGRSSHEQQRSPHERHLKKDPFKKEPSKKEPEKEGDPPPARAIAEHPAVDAYVRVTEVWPGEDLLPLIVQRLGDAPDRNVLAKAWMFWIASGNKRTNVLGVLDWYDEILENPNWTPADRFRSGSKTPRASPSANGHTETAAERAERLQKELEDELATGST